MESIGILGVGRFGQLLQRILQPHFAIKIFDPICTPSDPLTTLLQQRTLFIAVPIRHFETVIKEIAPQLIPGTTVIDVCSVKMYPVDIMKKYLAADIDIIATHPMFGPDSFALNEHSKNIMMNPVRDQYQRYTFWKNFFTQQKFHVVEMSPEQHDRYTAQSQGITHLIGRTLAQIDAKPTPIDTPGYTQLLTVMQHTCNDSWELFCDLQRFNPYSDSENKKLLQALEQVIHAISSTEKF